MSHIALAGEPAGCQRQVSGQEPRLVLECGWQHLGEGGVTTWGKVVSSLEIDKTGGEVDWGAPSGALCGPGGLGHLLDVQRGDSGIRWLGSRSVSHFHMWPLHTTKCSFLNYIFVGLVLS